MSKKAGGKLVIISLSLMLCPGAWGRVPDYEEPVSETEALYPLTGTPSCPKQEDLKERLEVIAPPIGRIPSRCLRIISNFDLKKMSRQGNLSAKYVLAVRRLKAAKHSCSNSFHNEMVKLFDSGFQNAGVTLARAKELCGDTDSAFKWYRKSMEAGAWYAADMGSSLAMKVMNRNIQR